MATKYTQGDTIAIYSAYVEGDIVKYNREYNKETVNVYSKTIKVLAGLNDKRMIELRYVMENGHTVNLSDIKEMVKKNAYVS